MLITSSLPQSCGQNLFLAYFLDLKIGNMGGRLVIFTILNKILWNFLEHFCLYISMLAQNPSS